MEVVPMECVNLKERFGKRFKVGHDEAYFAERGERALPGELPNVYGERMRPR